MKKSEALKILGLADGASDDEIKAAHRKKVVENHPDRVASDPVKYAAAEEKTKKINEARDVLLSRKWAPEYGYGAPYANPYRGGRPAGGAGYPGQGSGQDPFEGWPFGGQGSWVWTSWGDVSGADGQPFDPFSSVWGDPEPKTPEEQKAEAKQELKSESLVIAVKVLCLLFFTLLRMFPIGLFLYVIISLFYGLWKKFRGCLTPFLVPMALVLLPLLLAIAPRAGMLTIGLIFACIIVLILDIKNIRTLIKRYRSL